MPPIELDPIPDPAYPDGSVVGNFDGSGNPYEKQELLHRPHAFALMHGDGGAKVAFGQLMWRIDCFDLAWDSSAGYVEQASQETITSPHSRIPKLKTEDGEVMVAGVNTKYHELGAYGDVYLRWVVNLEQSEAGADLVDGVPDYDADDETKSEITKCWIEVAPTPNLTPGIGNLSEDGGPATAEPDPPTGQPWGDASSHRRDDEQSGREDGSAHRHEGTGTPEGEGYGYFRVKLGTVNEDEEIKQYVSSDVQWAITVLNRSYP